jgi:hypothetical protein
MTTEREAPAGEAGETMDFLNLSDAELQAMAQHLRRRAQRAIDDSRTAGPGEWAVAAAESNRAVQLYLRADEEIRNRARIVIDGPKDQRGEVDDSRVWAAMLAIAVAASAVMLWVHP